jgi:hypothetical protein
MFVESQWHSMRARWPVAARSSQTHYLNPSGRKLNAPKKREKKDFQPFRRVLTDFKPENVDILPVLEARERVVDNWALNIFAWHLYLDTWHAADTWRRISARMKLARQRAIV